MHRAWQNWWQENVAVRCCRHLYHKCTHVCMHRVLYLDDKTVVYSCQLVFVCIMNAATAVKCCCSSNTHTNQSAIYGYPIHPFTHPVLQVSQSVN